MADGKVDFSGVWNGGGPVGDVGQGLMPGEEISLTPWSKKIMDTRQSKDDPEANCLPTGIPRIAPYPWRVLQTPTHVFYLFEGNIHSFRQIFLDGRKHPADLDPTWYGDSIGTWDGDTLVVDTIGLQAKSSYLDWFRTPHTEKLHVVERFKLSADGKMLEALVKVEDPDTFNEPLYMVRRWNKVPNQLLEMVCAENNADHFGENLFPVPRAHKPDF
jgi:hypothetical protein